MKTIDNYINERLNPRHLGSTGRFPIDGSLQEVIDFLTNQGFKCIGRPKSLHPGLSVITMMFNDQHSKSFMVNETENGIRFADTSKHDLSDDNPIFYISGYRKGEWFYVIENYYRNLYDKDKFLQIINKKFKF